MAKTYKYEFSKVGSIEPIFAEFRIISFRDHKGKAIIAYKFDRELAETITPTMFENLDDAAADVGSRKGLTLVRFHTTLGGFNGG